MHGRGSGSGMRAFPARQPLRPGRDLRLAERDGPLGHQGRPGGAMGFKALRFAGFFIAGAAAFLLTACPMDDEAIIHGPRYLALGAHAGIGFGDACSGGGKINFCTTQGLTTLDSLYSKDEKIVKLVPGSE